MPDFTGQLGSSLSRLANIQLAQVPAAAEEADTGRPRWELAPATERWSPNTGPRWPLTPATTRWPLD